MPSHVSVDHKIHAETVKADHLKRGSDQQTLFVRRYTRWASCEAAKVVVFFTLLGHRAWAKWEALTQGSTAATGNWKEWTARQPLGKDCTLQFEPAVIEEEFSRLISGIFKLSMALISYPAPHGPCCMLLQLALLPGLSTWDLILLNPLTPSVFTSVLSTTDLHQISLHV